MTSRKMGHHNCQLVSQEVQIKRIGTENLLASLTNFCLLLKVT